MVEWHEPNVNPPVAGPYLAVVVRRYAGRHAEWVFWDAGAFRRPAEAEELASGYDDVDDYVEAWAFLPPLPPEK